MNLADASFPIEYHNEEIGFTNLLFHPKVFFRPATIPLLFQYYGPIFFLNYGHGLPDNFELNLQKNIDYAYLSMPPGFDIKNLSRGWRILPQYTPAVLSDGLQGWGNNFRDDVRNKIRKAEREHVEIAVSEYLPSDLWLSTFTRRKMSTPIPVDNMKTWCDILARESLLRIYLAKVQNQNAAFRCELIFGGFAYDWLAGSDHEFHSTGANQYLMAEIGNQMRTLNLRAWDLVGGQVQAIDDFKKSFGAIGIEYFHAIKAFNLKGRLFGLLRNFRNG